MTPFLATAALVNLGVGFALGIVFGGKVRGLVGSALVAVGTWVK